MERDFVRKNVIRLFVVFALFSFFAIFASTTRATMFYLEGVNYPVSMTAELTITPGMARFDVFNTSSIQSEIYWFEVKTSADLGIVTPTWDVFKCRWDVSYVDGVLRLFFTHDSPHSTLYQTDEGIFDVTFTGEGVGEEDFHDMTALIGIGDRTGVFDDAKTTPVPDPATIYLMATGIGMLGWARRKFLPA